MHFDDRLATVLRLPPSGDGIARIQFRQLVDILGRTPDSSERSETVEAAFRRLGELGNELPAADRARLLRQPLQPMGNSRLLAWLVEAEPDVACAAIAAARLDDAAWLDLIPSLPVRARGILRHRKDLSPAVEGLMERLGVHDRGLPAGPALPVAEPQSFASQPPEPLPEDPIPEVPQARFRRPTGDLAIDQDISEDVLDLLDMAENPPPPTSLSDWARARAAQQHKDLQQKVAADPAPPREAGIGAIVRRIEEFRKARAAAAHPFDPRTDSPRLPLGDAAATAHRLATAIDFTTGIEGRIDWADGPHAPSVVGLALAADLPMTDGTPPSSDIAITHAMRQRLPLRGARLAIDGAPAVTGIWQIDAVARFTHGRFAGYCGRLRRQAAPTDSASTSPPARFAANAEADRLREVLHELRTPANAIQVAAEIIQQQLYGPAPHEYRALAAAIAGDCAHILAGFEELDRLAKLETGAQPLEDGECDLARVLAQTVVRLRAWTEPRGGGFALASDPSAVSLPVRIARAEVERLVWRLFAALAGSTAPGETLDLGWALHGGFVELTVTLPAALAERDPDSLFEAVAGERGQSLAAGMFGIGFTLRLAAAEAAAAGGALRRVAKVLHLSLPALTDTGSGNSSPAVFSQQ
ncbi:sensor histidine kinase [Novosphingobium resinovorum]|uniref:sensor histidine kinase n=1 Tax=Novosphingobium resinovorum TaxID=158500 RepID=UPI002ED2C2B8|nr:sensor histidine kinase [Novosphingobium resinovorum]